MVYRGTCNICKENNITATYYGESGFSGYYRTYINKRGIMNKDLEKACAKHLQIYHHPEHEGDSNVFNITVIKTFSKPMPRKCTEAIFIHNNDAEIRMNSKTKFLQPAIPRVVTTREPPGGEGGEGGWRGGGRGRGGSQGGRGRRRQQG